MRLYTFTVDGQPRIGAEIAGRLLDLRAAGAAYGSHDAAKSSFADMLALIRGGETAIEAARRVVALAEESRPVPDGSRLSYTFEEIQLQAPLPRPGKILCSGVNYRGASGSTMRRMASTSAIPGSRIVSPWRSSAIR